jgi:alpha-galactosidase
VARVRGWGFELLKYDFSTYDTFAQWGFEMGAVPGGSGWHFAVRDLTTAEILLRFYRTVREAAGGMALIGCNTIGHLAAGLVDLQRTGDDTSGRQWERTRRMGINTLAFRLPQHGTFFSLDADCVAQTSAVPWEKDRQFLDLVARSGTALFISVDPRTVTDEQREAFASAMHLALDGGTAGGIEPLDWLTTNSPSSWKAGPRTIHYDWLEDSGAYPLGG